MLRLIICRLYQLVSEKVESFRVEFSIKKSYARRRHMPDKLRIFTEYLSLT